MTFLKIFFILLVKKLPDFMEFKNLSCSWYSESVESKFTPDVGLPSEFLLSAFSTNIVYELSISHMRATCSAQLLFFYFFLWFDSTINFVAKYKIMKPLVIQFSQSHCTLLFLRYKYSPYSMFSNALKLMSKTNWKYKVVVKLLLSWSTTWYYRSNSRRITCSRVD